MYLKFDLRAEKAVPSVDGHYQYPGVEFVVWKGLEFP